MAQGGDTIVTIVTSVVMPTPSRAFVTFTVARGPDL